jgi:hypothetical protein
MNRKFAVFAAALAAFVLAGQSAEAALPHPVDHRIRAVNTGVGLAWTGAALAMKGVSDGFAIGATTIGCMATGPMVATAVLHRPLTYREAHVILGSCLIPFIGGWLVNEWYNEGVLVAPDEKRARHTYHRHSRLRLMHARR